MRIGVFDSGLGGLSVLNELIRKAPHHHYLYVADNLHSPLGTKSKDQILKYALEMMTFLANQKVDVMVVACNTIGSYLSPSITSIFSQPIYNIAHFNRTLLEQSKPNRMIFLATKATIESPFFLDLSRDHQFINGSQLVPLIERQVPRVELLAHINFLLGKSSNFPRHLVLGCTHFGLIADCFLTYDHNLIISEGSHMLARNISEGNDEFHLDLYFSRRDAYDPVLIQSIVKTDRLSIHSWN